LDTTPQMAKISTENPTTPIQETPQPVATTLTEVVEIAPPFKLPMEN
jgi:hypothetical protein